MASGITVAITERTVGVIHQTSERLQDTTLEQIVIVTSPTQKTSSLRFIALLYVTLVVEGFIQVFPNTFSVG